MTDMKNGEQTPAGYSAGSTVAAALRRVLRGYARVGSWILHLISLAAAAAIVSLAIVVPLWLAATRATEAYTVAVITLTAAGILTALLRRVRGQSIGAVIPIIKTAGRVLAILALIYALVFLFVRGYTTAAIVITLAGLVWVGYAAAGRRTTRHDKGAT